ncbi:hypothetical protein ACWGID_09070 [Kribbella sp. NPDC054772]
MEAEQRNGIGRRALLKATSIAAGGIVLGASSAAEAAGIPSKRLVPMNDRNIRSQGRWQEQANGDIYGYYQSGLELDFTGTAISLTLEGACRLLYRVDGGAVQRNITDTATETTDGPHPTVAAHDKVAINLATSIQQHLPAWH